MKTLINTIKNDLYRVFVKGDADTVQMAHAYFVLAVPALALLFTFGKFPV
ncbi:hypothetical protein [Mucilaginibacter pedocola]|nr:hypothetical protein [Mucilaginibacter pedocola]